MCPLTLSITKSSVHCHLTSTSLCWKWIFCDSHQQSITANIKCTRNNHKGKSEDYRLKNNWLSTNFWELVVGSVDLPQQYKITRKDATQETFLVVQGEVIEDLVPINLTCGDTANDVDDHTAHGPESLVTLVGLIVQEINMNSLSLIEVEWTLPHMMWAALLMYNIWCDQPSWCAKFYSYWWNRTKHCGSHLWKEHSKHLGR